MDPSNQRSGFGADALVPVLYDELKRMAAAYLRHERPGHTLQPTALVHEVFLKLVDQDRACLKDAAHIKALAAMTMRRVLVDHARRRDTLKRGAGVERVTLDEAIVGGHGAGDLGVLDLDAALERLALLDERRARVVELRFFGGLSTEETAEAMGIARVTVTKDWRFAKAWLAHELGGASGDL